MNGAREPYIPPDPTLFIRITSPILKNSPLYAGYSPERFNMFIVLVRIAYEISGTVHAMDVRRMRDVEYFSHPLAIAKIILEDFPAPSVEKVAIAFVHDILEDHREITPEALREMFISKWKELIPRIQMPEEVRTAIDDIVSSTEFLTKKMREDMLSPEERIIYNEQENNPHLYADIPPEQLMKYIANERVDYEYIERMQTLTKDRKYLSIVSIKLADKYHNLCTSHEETTSRIKAMIHSIEDVYLPIAEKLSFDTAIAFLSEELLFLRKTLVARRINDHLEDTEASHIAHIAR